MAQEGGFPTARTPVDTGGALAGGKRTTGPATHQVKHFVIQVKLVYQTIAEPIAVSGVYQNFRFIPKKFQWGSREYVIDRITLVSDIKDGEVKKRLYSVCSGPNLYRLEFNRETEEWRLEEVWCE